MRENLVIDANTKIQSLQPWRNVVANKDNILIRDITLATAQFILQNLHDPQNKDLEVEKKIILRLDPFEKSSIPKQKKLRHAFLLQIPCSQKNYSELIFKNLANFYSTLLFAAENQLIYFSLLTNIKTLQDNAIQDYEIFQDDSDSHVNIAKLNTIGLLKSSYYLATALFHIKNDKMNDALLCLGEIPDSKIYSENSNNIVEKRKELVDYILREIIPNPNLKDDTGKNKEALTQLIEKLSNNPNNHWQMIYDLILYLRGEQFTPLELMSLLSLCINSNEVPATIKQYAQAVFEEIQLEISTKSTTTLDLDEQKSRRFTLTLGLIDQLTQIQHHVKSITVKTPEEIDLLQLENLSSMLAKIKEELKQPTPKSPSPKSPLIQFCLMQNQRGSAYKKIKSTDGTPTEKVTFASVPQ